MNYVKFALVIAFVTVPGVLIGIALCCTVFGIPLGLALMGASAVPAVSCLKQPQLPQQQDTEFNFKLYREQMIREEAMKECQQQKVPWKI